MSFWLTTFSATLVASLTLTPLVRSLAQRWGLEDRPDGQRKLHPSAVPLCGGVAVYVSLLLGLLVAGLVAPQTDGPLGSLATAVAVAAGIVCLFGSIDDCWALGSRLKLLSQVCAVVPIVAMGYYVDRIVAFGYPLELGWIGVPLTVAWLVGCINALNLLDGMDGLASTVGLLTTLMMAIIATSMGNTHVAVMAVVLAGALAGFLVYNLPPASIFLGDSGSMVIGLVLGVLGIQGAMKTSTTLAITVPAVVMSLPMFDMILAIVRRKLTGRRVDLGDREHVHHRLLDRGLSPWQVLCLLGALCLATGAATTAATIFRIDVLAWITAVALMVLAIRLRIFGHHELALVKGTVARRLRDLSGAMSSLRLRRRRPDAITLARLPFQDAWGMLIEWAAACQVWKLELILSSQGEPPRHFQWIDAATESEAEYRWNIALALHDRDCRVCELRATGGMAMDPGIFCSTGLTWVLIVFATHFAEHAAEIPNQAPLGSAQVSPAPDYGHRDRAA